MATLTEGSILLAVSAEVLFHDGANWQRVDNTNGMQNSSGLSTIQLIKNSQESMSIYRIVALRNMDNQRIVDQSIFHRLKYKEATPSFHQWRNEHKQVIGLNFQNEQDARHFYAAVRQALESVVNLQHQQQNISSSIAPKNQTDSVTYQDPQSFHHHHHPSNNHYAYHQQQQCQDIYASQDNSIPPYNDPMKMNGCVDHGNGNQRLVAVRQPPPIPFVASQQQQQNLVRRASQGSNISSSTGGSLPGPNYVQGMIVPTGNNNNNSINHVAPELAMNNTNNHHHQLTPPSTLQLESHGQQQHQQQTVLTPQEQHANNGGINNIAIKAQMNIVVAAPPPPPPPPPPDLKKMLSASKEQSFADQLRHVQLRKNSPGDGKTLAPKSSPLGLNNNTNGAGGGAGPSTKMHSGGKQDLISELADRLNKRKMNVGEGVASPQQPNMASNSAKMPVNSHKKISSVTSLSSQDEPAAANNNGSSLNGKPNTIAATIAPHTNNASDENGAIKRTGGIVVTREDLAQLKSELMEAFAEELNKLKVEMAQTIRNEIAKLINHQK